jgi:class 3 adenylate cyclase
MEPQFRFCKAPDGTRIAYGVLGSGPPLVLVYSWGNSIDTEWQHPTCRAAHERLAAHRTLVMVTRRGIGGSDREVADISLEAQTSDIAAVVDALRLEQVDIWAFSDGNAPAVAYAVANPERVSRLVFMSWFARGCDIMSEENAHTLIELVHGNWDMARRAITTLVFPHGPIEEQRWLSRQWSQNISAEMCARYLRFMAAVDLTDYLPLLQAPTLVLHRRGDLVHPLAQARATASQIPNVRFHTLEGDITYAWLDEIEYFDTVLAFLDEGREPAPALPAPQPPLRTILFTDIEEHTTMMQRLGDELGRAVLREHEHRTRDALDAHGGREIKSMGDGFMASFGSVQAALDCAVALQRAFAGSDCAGEPVRVRIGLNAGEPIEEEDDLFGASVILAARASAQARGGQIYVTNVVRELAAGKQFRFTDAGAVTLRGFDSPTHLYELAWQ